MTSSWLKLPATDELPGGTGVVELANTSGIELLGDERRGTDASTLGFGQAIAAALTAGVIRIVVGIGSSSSTDGGIGMLTALGARFLNDFEASMSPGAAGLDEVHSVDLTALKPLPAGGVSRAQRRHEPAHRPRGRGGGSSGRRRGSTTRRSRAPMRGWAIWRRSSARTDLAERPGAGAAGGTGFGLLVWGAELVPGSAAIAELDGPRRRHRLGGHRGHRARADTTASRRPGRPPPASHSSHATAGVPVQIVAGAIDADTSSFAGCRFADGAGGILDRGARGSGALAPRRGGTARPLIGEARTGSAGALSRAAPAAGALDGREPYRRNQPGALRHMKRIGSIIT